MEKGNLNYDDMIGAGKALICEQLGEAASLLMGENIIWAIYEEMEKVKRFENYEPQFCTQCVSMSDAGGRNYCNNEHIRASAMNFVNGEVDPEKTRCGELRSIWGLCGYEGRYFKPKELIAPKEAAE